MDGWVDTVSPYVGAPVSMERLKSAGGGGAFRVRGSCREAVLKIGVEAPELAFYRDAAGPLTKQGMRIPALLGSGNEPSWILLEYLPGILARDRWGSDPEMVRYLARWHALAPSVLETHPIPGHAFRWEPDLLSLPLTPSPSEVCGRFADELEEIFSPVGWVHGDPNVTNWVSDADGAVVLTDWARVGRAHPAVDLAILLPGMPDARALKTLADAYCRLRPEAGPVPHMARLMAVAKWWTALDFLHLGRQGKLSVDAEPGLRMLEELLPNWTHAALGSR